MNKSETVDIDKTLLTCGYNHIVFSVGNKTNVDQLTNKLKIDGYKVISEPRKTGDGIL